LEEDREEKQKKETAAPCVERERRFQMGRFA